MKTISFNNKSYQVDGEDFLLEFDHWDEDFALGLAPRIKITGGLTEEHWYIINFIRSYFERTGRCPLIFQVCRQKDMRLQEFKKLFPTGYLRGACKLAGITYKEGYIGDARLAAAAQGEALPTPEKAYKVDVRGFLVDPYAWDEQYAVYKAYEMKMPEKLTQRHWQIIHYLREHFKRNFTVPTIYKACEDNGLDLDDLEQLFPDGYHRGAVKIAGLRVR